MSGFKPPPWAKADPTFKAPDYAQEDTVEVQIGEPVIKDRKITLPPEQIDLRPDTLGNIAEVAKQGFSGGISDDAVGAGQAIHGAFIRATDRLKDGQIVRNPLDELKDVVKDYRGARDSERRTYERAREESPVAAGVTRVVTAIPGAIATAPLATARLGVAGGSALLGGVQSLASSNADNATDLAKDTGAGAALGVLGVKAPISMSTLALGAAAFGDKIGMSDADRVSAGLGGLLGLPASIAARLAAKTSAKASKVNVDARKEVAEGLVNEDMAEGLEMNKAADELFKQTAANKKAELKKLDKRADFREEQRMAPELEAREMDKARTDLLAATEKSKKEGLKQLDARGLAAKNRFEEKFGKPKVVKDRYGEPSGKVYEKAEARIKAQRDLEDKAFRSAQDQKQAKTVGSAEQLKVLQELAELNAEEAALPQSVEGKRGSAYQAYGTRYRNYKDMVGEEPDAAFPELAPTLEKVRGTYRTRSPEILGEDPDLQVAAYEKAERAALAQRRESLMKRMDALLSGGDGPVVASPDETWTGAPRTSTSVRVVDADGYLVDEPALPPRPGPARMKMRDALEGDRRDPTFVDGDKNTRGSRAIGIKDLDGYEDTLAPGHSPNPDVQKAVEQQARRQSRSSPTSGNDTGEQSPEARRRRAERAARGFPEGERYDGSNPDHHELWPDGSSVPKKQFIGETDKPFKYGDPFGKAPRVDEAQLPGAQKFPALDVFKELAKRNDNPVEGPRAPWIDERPPSMESRIDARVKGADAKMVAAAKRGAMSKEGILGAAGLPLVMGPKGVAAGLGAGATKALYQLAAKDPAVRARLAGEIERRLLLKPEVAQKFRETFAQAVGAPQGPNLAKLSWLFQQPGMAELLEEEPVSE